MSSHRAVAEAPRGFRRRPGGQITVILVLFLVGGTLAGLLWEWWWDPPTGIVLDHRFRLDEYGLPQEFSGTGQYVVVALVAGCLMGALVGLVLPRGGFLVLGATLVAAALSAWVMAFVGHSVGPPDPDVLAEDLVDLTALVSDLSVTGRAPFLALPIGALGGLAAVMLLQAARGAFRSGRGPIPSKVSA